MTALRAFTATTVRVLVLLAIAIAMLAVLLIATGHEVMPALSAMVRGAFGSYYAITSATIVRMVPLALAGLAVSVAFRAGILNVGAEGQLLVGAAAATAISGTLLGVPWFIGIPVMLVAGAMAGGVWAAIAGALRLRFGVLEVISTIMLNFVAQYLTGWLVRGPLQEPTRVNPQSATLAPELQMPVLLEGTRLHAGVLLAVIVAVGVWWWLRADQIITGTAITLFALGLTGTVYRTVYGSGGVALTTPTAVTHTIPVLSALPLIGRAFFAQPLVTYALYLIAPLLAWWMQRTHAGLALRAVGEYPPAAIAAGISPRRTQLYAVLFAGAMAGLAGATLVLAQAGTFAEGMSAGRGFIAIAIVVLGRWRPLGVAAAALLFGAATSLQTLFQSMGWTGIPYQLFLAVPYILTLVVLAVTGKRGARRPA